MRRCRNSTANTARQTRPMTASLTPDPGPAPLHGLDSAAQLVTRFTTQLSSLPRPASRGPVLIAVAHGSRDPEALRTVTALLASIRAERPGLRVELGHIELNEPSLPAVLDAIPAGTDTVLVPLLFGRGHHVKHDIPHALSGAPHLRATVAEPLGGHPLLAAALHERLLEAGWAEPVRTGTCAVVLAAAGSRDPESAAAVERTAAQLRERLGGAVRVVPAYASAARPAVAEAVAALRTEGHNRIALASCFIAPGRFSARCAAEAPWIAAAPVGAHPALAQLVLHRFGEARAAATRTATSAATRAASRSAAAGAGVRRGAARVPLAGP
jgi:sirohydrochlorin ferrochelatase